MEERWDLGSEVRDQGESGRTTQKASPWTQLSQGNPRSHFQGMQLVMHSKQLISVKWQLINKNYFQVQGNSTKEVLTNGACL